jgi:hypothetical protein
MQYYAKHKCFLYICLPLSLRFTISISLSAPTSLSLVSICISVSLSLYLLCHLKTNTTIKAKQQVYTDIYLSVYINLMLTYTNRFSTIKVSTVHKQTEARSDNIFMSNIIPVDFIPCEIFSHFYHTLHAMFLSSI